MKLAEPQRRNKRLSLIPLIDVMLVLLFFFMLATSYVDYGRTRIDLAPSQQAGASGAADEGSLVVLDESHVRYGGAALTLAEALPQLREAQGSRELRVSPAPGLPLQALIAVWEQLQAAGLKAQLGEGGG